MSSDVKLLPCPLCESPSSAVSGPDDGAEIFCTECGLSLESQTGETIDLFYSRWNTRALPPEGREAVAWRVSRGHKMYVGMVTADPKVRDVWLEAKLEVETLYAAAPPLPIQTVEGGK